MAEKLKRGGVGSAYFGSFFRANNKYIDNSDKNEQSTSEILVDASNLYSGIMENDICCSVSS